jgi:hypothetical protein
MSKRRNSKTLRKQEYPDFEDVDMTDELVVEEMRSTAYRAQPPSEPTAQHDSGYSEGDLVTCPDTAKNKEGGSAMTTGTIVQVLHGEASVLDGAGFVHRVKTSQVYPAQD